MLLTNSSRMIRRTDFDGGFVDGVTDSDCWMKLDRTVRTEHWNDTPRQNGYKSRERAWEYWDGRISAQRLGGVMYTDWNLKAGRRYSYRYTTTAWMSKCLTLAAQSLCASICLQRCCRLVSLVRDLSVSENLAENPVSSSASSVISELDMFLSNGNSKVILISTTSYAATHAGRYVQAERCPVA